MINKLLWSVVFLIAFTVLSFANALAAEMRSADEKFVHEYITYTEFSSFFNKTSEYESSLKRGEFETKNEYAERLKTVGKFSDEHFFIKVPSYDHFFSYVIDSELYKFEGWNVFSKESSVTIQEIEIDNGSYSGENSFGVKRDVKKIEARVYGINIIGIKQQNIHKYDYLFTFKLKPSIAKELKNNLAVIVECNIAKKDGNYVRHDTIWHAATISEPYERTTKKFFVNVRVIKIFIVNKHSDEIVAVVSV